MTTATPSDTTTASLSPSEDSYPKKLEFCYVDCWIGLRKQRNRLTLRLQDSRQSTRFASLNETILVRLIRESLTLKKLILGENKTLEEVGPDAVIWYKRIHRYGREHYYLVVQRYENRLYTFLKVFTEAVEPLTLESKPLSFLRLDVQYDDFRRLLPYARLDASTIAIGGSPPEDLVDEWTAKDDEEFDALVNQWTAEVAATATAPEESSTVDVESSSTASTLELTLPTDESTMELPEQSSESFGCLE